MSDIKNHEQAYDILGLNPQFTGIKDINNKMDLLKQRIRSFSYLKKQLDSTGKAKEFLKNADPKLDNISNDDLLKSYTDKSPEWKTYYEKYHIYFEHRNNNLKNKIFYRICLYSLFVSGTTLNYILVYANNNDIFLDLSTLTLTAIGSFICGLEIDNTKKLIQEKNSATLKLFNQLHKTNNLLGKNKIK